MRFVHFLLLLFAVTLGVIGQIAIKYGLRRLGYEAHGTSVSTILSALLTPYVALGFGLYAVSSLAWLVVLSRIKQLSVAYPMISVGYVLVVVLSWHFFQDSINLTRVVGLALICAGVALVGFSS